MHGLVRGGADIIELGVPFSDPMADGPVIQKASERALARGIGMAQVLDAVRTFRRQDSEDAGRADGLCQPGGALRPAPRRRCLHRRRGRGRRRRRAGGGLPARGMRGLCRRPAAKGLDPIFLLAPTSTDARIREVGRLASGYVYYVSLKGVTGAGHLDTAGVAAMLPRIRALVSVPVRRGFRHPRRDHVPAPWRRWPTRSSSARGWCRSSKPSRARMWPRRGARSSPKSAPRWTT